MDNRTGACSIGVSGNSVDRGDTDPYESEEGDIELLPHKDEDGEPKYVRNVSS